MLCSIDSNGDVKRLPGLAHIVIAIDDKGAASLQAFFLNRPDSAYFSMPDARLFERELPKLVAELRAQIQGLSGSAVTE